MWKYLVDSLSKILSSFLSGLKFVVNFKFGTKDEVNSNQPSQKDETSSK